MARLDDGGKQRLAARDAGGFRGRGVEWAVTALFIQRLNGLRGEAEKCQRGEDDYERYRSPSLPRKRKENSPPPPTRLPQHPLRPAPMDAGRQVEKRGRARGRMLCPLHSFSSPRSCWLLFFLLAVHLLYSNTDNAYPRPFSGCGPSEQLWQGDTAKMKDNQQGWKNGR